MLKRRKKWGLRGVPSSIGRNQAIRPLIQWLIVIHEPNLLICDEPTSALDRDTGAKIMQLLRDSARKPDRCVLVVTHDNRVFKYADRMTEMEDGRVSRVHETTEHIRHE